MRSLIPRLGACALWCAAWLAAPVHAAPGDWDRSYGQNGLLPFSIPGKTFTVRAWEPQPDGKVLIAGHTTQNSTWNETSEVIVARFNSNGSVDTSFDGDGYALFDTANNLSGGTVDLRRQSDGKILVVGQAGADYNQALVVRFDVDGSRDMGFGTAGQVLVSYPTSSSILNPSLLLAPNGSAYVVGRVDSLTPAPALAAVGVTRLTNLGAIDTTFGTGGTGMIRGSDHLFPEAFAVASDGKIIVGGDIGPYNNASPFVARMTATGQPDATFGTGGVVVIPFLQGAGYVSAVAAAANGKVIVSGTRHDANDFEVSFIARTHDDGTFDSGFGSDGRNVLESGVVNSIFVESDGKITTGGTSWDQSGFATLGHYNSDGSPDVTFGIRGLNRTDFASGNVLLPAELQRVRRASDGSYFALVRMTDSTDQSYALAHFLAQGQSAGVLGIRAEFEAPDSGGFNLVSEDAPPLKFYVYRTGGADGQVSVQYRTVADTAIAGQDFVAKTGTVTLNDGETSALIEVQLIDDAVPEANFSEKFHVELFGPTGGAGLSKKRATIEINTDFDWGQRIAVYGTDAAFIEGGTARVILYRSGDMRGPMTLNYTVTGGTASAGSDYTGASGSVQWPNNEGGPREISIPLVNDSVVETIEDFTVTFTDPTGVATGLTPAVIHVVDDDDAASSVAYGATIAFPNEGAGSITYTVYRLGDASAALSVPWSAGDCSGQTAAIPGQDYITSSGTLSWAPGETGPKTIALALIDDANFEGIETCAVSINPSYPVTAQYNPVAWFHILDNDGTPTEPTLNIGAGGSVLESAGTINLPVTLTGLQASPYGVSVQYGIEYGTASQNDVSTGIGTLVWLPGETGTKYIAVSIANDSRDESDETFTVGLGVPQYGAQVGSSAAAGFTITDDDPTPAGQATPVPPGVVAVNPNISISEGQRTATIQVRRVGDTTGVLAFDYGLVPGTAGSPGDFVASGGFVNWNSNETATKSIEVQINGDAVAESPEGFTVQLTPSFGTTIPKVIIPVTITDDDAPAPPARIAFINASETVSEVAATVSVQVGRTGNSTVAASVNYATTAGTAGAADFTSASGTLTWAANDTANKLITLTLLPDALDEPDENFTITLSNPSSGTQIDTASVTVSIQDDDVPPVVNPPNNGGGGGGGGGGGAQDYLSLLLLAAVLFACRRRRAA